MLDTWSEVTILSHSLVKNCQMKSTTQALKANESSIPVLGEANTWFETTEVGASVTGLVTEHVARAMTGITWLRKHGAEWSFKEDSACCAATRPSEQDLTDYAHISQQNKPDPLETLVERLPTDLSTEQRNSAVQLLEKNRDVFSHDDFDLGRTHQVQHRIDTGNNRPFRQPLRRHPLAQLDVIDDHVDKLLQHGLIEPAASPWASNIVLVRKKDGNLRFCVDYRQLNSVTYKDSYPLPRIESCLDSLNGASHFSTLVLRSGYWQVGMDVRDADKTAFVTRRGTFRFKVLRFGLTNAPSRFQRFMDLVLAGMTYESCLVYFGSHYRLR